MTDPSENPLKRFIREIHRRSLWQVLGVYMVSGWLVYEAVQSLTEGLGLPAWFPPLAFVFLLLGLPMVLATAFVQAGGSHEPSSEASGLIVGVRSGTSGVRSGRNVESTAPSRLLTWRNAVLGGVGAFLLVGGIGLGWLMFGETGGGTTATAFDAASALDGAPTSIERSIAVLPFDDLSPEGDQRYFVEGLSEEIIHALAQIPGLEVAARTSTFLLAEQGIDIGTLASTLGVANVLEGSVRKSGDRIRISAQLIEAESGFHLWSKRFDRELTDIFAIQDEIARAITDQLQVRLSGDDQTRLVTEATRNTEAHEAYLRGRYFWSQRTEASLRTAITEFQRAVDLDPDYAEAYSGLADSHLNVDTYTRDPEEWDFETNLEQTLIAARRAVSLAPDLGMARASLGYGLWAVGEWESAGRELERAIELSPGYATAHQWYGNYLLTTGRADEGIIHAAQAVELDPVSQISSAILGIALIVAGRTEEAIEQFRETVELAPEWLYGWALLLEALMRIGDNDKALEASLAFGQLTGIDLRFVPIELEESARFRETGQPRLMADEIIERFENKVRAGAYGWAAVDHVTWNADLPLGDDLRYQALLAEAGITW